ncbi:MAG: hypothetical protein QXF52_04650 [Thermoproteota archaeon]
MRLSKLKQVLLWELHDAWAFPFAEILIIGFFSQTLSITFISYGAIDESGFLSGGMDITRFITFLRMEYPVIIFCTLIPAKVFGECIEKRKVHIPLMAGASRNELFISKLVVTVLLIWIVQLGSLTVEAVLNQMFAFPISVAAWVSTLIGVLMFSLFVCSFSILLSVLLKRFSLATLAGIGLLAILNYWAFQMPLENLAGYLSPMRSALVVEEAIHIPLAQAMADAHVYPMHPPLIQSFSIPYLLLLPLVFMLAAALVFKVIDLD